MRVVTCRAGPRIFGIVWAAFRLQMTLLYYPKTVLAGLIFTTCAAYGVVASVVLTLVGRRRMAQYATARAFHFLMSRLLGLRVRIVHPERLETPRPAILVGNHQLLLDILVLGRVFPTDCTVTLKRLLQWVPVLGWFMLLSGTFFLDRGNSTKSRATLARALDGLKQRKGSVWMFPEGTRSYSSEPMLLPFKKGAFHLAVQLGIPIVPVVVSNTLNLVDGLKKVFASGEVVVEVLEPVETAGLGPDDVTALTEQVRLAMLERVLAVGYLKRDGEAPVLAVPEVSATLLSVLDLETTPLLRGLK